MKKLNKLQINSEKVMKNDELLTLRGGYDEGTCGYNCTLNSHSFSGCGWHLAEIQDILVWYETDGYSCNWCCDSCGSTTYCGS